MTSGRVSVNSPTGANSINLGDNESRGQTPSRNNNEQTQISVNSGGTQVSYHNQAARVVPKQTIRKSTGKGKKKKQVGNPL